MEDFRRELSDISFWKLSPEEAINRLNDAILNIKNNSKDGDKIDLAGYDDGSCCFYIYRGE